MTVDTLQTLVSSAIWRAEQLEELGPEAAYSAWADVSKLEEEIAKAIPAWESEGRIARRGAVRAALKAQDCARAQELVALYQGQNGTSAALEKDFRRLLKANSEELTDQFPHAARHYRPKEVQGLANRLLQAGPFWLVA
jgi:hypothetical protein